MHFKPILLAVTFRIENYKNLFMIHEIEDKISMNKLVLVYITFTYCIIDYFSLSHFEDEHLEE